MDMYETIKNFPSQFAYEPTVESEDRLGKFEKFAVIGMGGSHVAADLLMAWNPELDVVIHSDYGLPPLLGHEEQERLIILSSYSGNTEELLDAFDEARKKGLPVAALSVGGKLIEKAKSAGDPFIQMPDPGIQPRMATGFSIKAMLKVMRQEGALREVAELVGTLDSNESEKAGKELAGRLRGKTPIIYTSGRNRGIAYTWKITFNETGKIPAFYNLFPELNHNEMTGFDVRSITENLSKNFHFIFLKDAEDDPRIQKRMELTEKILQSRGLSTEIIALAKGSTFYKIFSSVMFADWAAYYTAGTYGFEPNEVPMVEEFKGLMQNI